VNTPSATRIKVWDLPTRIFHWLLAAAAVALLITGKQGGDAMAWHARAGYAVGALLLFRIVWGFAGGRWSRFSAFPPSMSRAYTYLRSPRAPLEPGHNPLGAFSVYAMLLFFCLQFASGLFSETKEDFAGPLSSMVSNAAVHLMTGYHKRVGQWVLIALVTTHIAAVVYHLVRRRNLIGAMVHGQLSAQGTPSRDDTATRWLAGILMSLCSLVIWGVVKLGD
jgi:cytochrome b